MQRRSTTRAAASADGSTTQMRRQPAEIKARIAAAFNGLAEAQPSAHI
jgi:hypothetical protein